MCYILIACLGLFGTLEQLGSEKYAVRERAEKQLRNEGVSGFITAWAGQNSNDPEITTRCRRIVAERDEFWAWFNAGLLVALTLYPADDGDTWELPAWLNEKLEQFTQRYYLDLGYLEESRRKFRGAIYVD